jgi:hypothetical protein
MCGATVHGGISVSTSNALVLIGDGDNDESPTCAGNTVAGGATISGNTAGLELGGNSISGGVTITGNTNPSGTGEDKAPEINANTINGSLACSSNNPAPATPTYKNSGAGSRTGQCTGF